MHRSIQVAAGWSFALLLAASALAGAARGADEFVPPPQGEREAVAAIARQGGRSQVDGEYRVTSVITGANFTNEDLKVLAACERLTGLQLNSPKVNDEGLAHLKGLMKLTTITITASGLTDEGITSLRTALPNCRINSFGSRGGTRGGGPGGPAGGGPPAGGFGSRGPRGGTGSTTFGAGGFGSRTISPTSLARNTAVQDDLKLTPEQRQQITAASDVTALLRAADEKIAAVLTPEQKARLRQIELQQRGIAGLLREEITKELKLSADQQASIRKLGDDTAASVRALTSDLLAQRQQGTSTADLLAKAQEKAAAANKERDEKILAVLTDEQRQTWKTMLGPDGPKVSTFGDRAGSGGFAGGFASRTPAEAAKAIFDQYDADRNGSLTEAEFPENNRTRSSMSRSGITLQLPFSREDFEKAYIKYAEGPRRRE